jgi:hypothetical protein
VTDDELATIWRAAGDGQYSAIVKLLMLTGAAPGRDCVVVLVRGQPRGRDHYLAAGQNQEPASVALTKDQRAIEDTQS